MRQELDRRDDLTCYAVTSMQDIAIQPLCTFLNAAWEADYGSTARIAFDEPFISRLMADHAAWVACLIADTTGQLIGFELALERTLYWHGQPFTSYYNRLFTIHPHYRRRGYGRWMLHCINQLLFEQRGADLVCVAFHAGHAGLPTVQQTHAALPGWQVKCFATAPLWGCRLDRTPCPQLQPTMTATRLTTSPDGTAWVGDPAISLALPSPFASLETFHDALRRQYHVAFGLHRSFQAQYLCMEALDAGTYGYCFGDRAVCSVSYDIVTLRDNKHDVGRIGRIQAVYTHHCQVEHLSQALAHLCQAFRNAGCILASVFDLGGLPHAVLHALAFRLTGDESIIAVRGPRTVIEALPPVGPPFFIDL